MIYALADSRSYNPLIPPRSAMHDRRFHRLQRAGLATARNVIIQNAAPDPPTPPPLRPSNSSVGGGSCQRSSLTSPTRAYWTAVLLNAVGYAVHAGRLRDAR